MLALARQLNPTFVQKAQLYLVEYLEQKTALLLHLNLLLGNHPLISMLGNHPLISMLGNHPPTSMLGNHPPTSMLGNHPAA
jgi:hypothetical protein